MDLSAGPLFKLLFGSDAGLPKLSTGLPALSVLVPLGNIFDCCGCGVGGGVTLGCACLGCCMPALFCKSAISCCCPKSSSPCVSLCGL